MKINPAINISQVLAAYQGHSPAKAERQTSAKMPASSTNVELSAGSQAIHSSANDIDIAKVNAIREALANGTLKINPEKIASGLIDSATELLD